MARPAAVVHVEVEYLGNELGLWCWPCALSSGARIWFTTGVAGETSLRSNVFCTECGSRDVVDA